MSSPSEEINSFFPIFQHTNRNFGDVVPIYLLTFIPIKARALQAIRQYSVQILQILKCDSLRDNFVEFPEPGSGCRCHHYLSVKTAYLVSSQQQNVV